MKNLIFYILTVVIWGSTWIAIKFQIDCADPMVSVGYRFVLSSVILILWCLIFKINLKFKAQEYIYMCVQGIILFGVNYLLIYMSELYLTSGITAVLFSTILIMNVINGFIFLKIPITSKHIAGGIIGLLGIVLVFKNEIVSFSLDGKLIGVLFALGGTFLASLGNILSARNQKNSLPVIQTNAFGMGFGGIVMVVLAFVSGKDMALVLTMPYLSSILYLSIFGSIIAFGCYLSLIGSIGPGNAAYTSLLIPVAALAISTVWEGYVWNFWSISGVILIIFGNFIIIRKKDENKKPVETENSISWRNAPVSESIK